MVVTKKMNPRDTILNSIRANRLPNVELPQLCEDWTTYADPQAKFSEVIEMVGGKCMAVKKLADVASFIHSDSRFSNCKSMVSQISGLESTIELSEIDRPHDLNALDLAVLSGQLGVAENGAVWVAAQAFKHRAVLFIVEHLVLVVPGSQIVSNMHEAYDRLSLGESRFDCFISGPSKTADIEQALVIGAQDRARTPCS